MTIGRGYLNHAGSFLQKIAPSSGSAYLSIGGNMTLKNILLAAAGVSAVTGGAQAADAVIAAQPEPLEYVRVCDAFGNGYFFIPGTETCLKLEGFVRFQVNAGPNASGFSDYDAFTRAQVQFTAKSDTEYGPLTSVMTLKAFAGKYLEPEAARLESAYIDVGGFRAGLFYGWWDAGLSGDTDAVGSPYTLLNSVRYQYEAPGFYAGLSVDELEAYAIDKNDVGVAFGIGGKGGGFTYQIIGGYDTDFEEGAIRAMGTAEIGPGTLGLAAVYASNPNGYYATAEWATAAEYAFKATDKLVITPGIQYFGNYGANAKKSEFGTVDAWKAGLTLDYQFVDNFYAKASLQYLDVDNAEGVTTGFLRLQRAF